MSRRRTFKQRAMRVNGPRRMRERVLKGAARRGLRRAQRGFVRTTGFFGQVLELKFHDLDIDDGVIAAAGSITDSVNKIAQGTTESERIGRKCTIKSINWRFNVELPEVDASAQPVNPDVCRVILYLDKQCNGAAATVTGILESANFQSFNNLANKSRFRTLMDRTYTLNVLAGGSNGTTSDWCETVQHDTFFKKVNIPVEFDSTAGAITEIRSNNIGLLLISKQGRMSFNSKMRIRFVDG